jgi:hypothetical protein
MQARRIQRRCGAILLLLAAAVVGVASLFFLFAFAFVGALSGLLAIVAGRAILACVGGYLSDRAFRMSRAERITLLGAYETGPLLMLALGIGNLLVSGSAGFQPLAWFVFAIPDFLAGWWGIALGRRR